MMMMKKKKKQQKHLNFNASKIKVIFEILRLKGKTIFAMLILVSKSKTLVHKSLILFYKILHLSKLSLKNYQRTF